MANPIGPLPQAPEEYDQAWMQRVMDRQDQIFALLNRAAGTGYQMTNVTTTKALDADSTSTAELADVLGNLIDEMKLRGMLGG